MHLFIYKIYQDQAKYMKAYNHKQNAGVGDGERRGTKYDMVQEYPKGKNGSNTTSRNENTFGMPNQEKSYASN